MNRRQFLKDSALFAAALAATSTLKTGCAPTGGSQDVNGQLRIAQIGVRGQGMIHLKGYVGKHNCVVTTLCDVDDAVIGPAMDYCTNNQKVKPTFTKDIRKVLDDKSIDCISITIPNHWHALAAIWAMQAGKDVYCEKPVSHNVWEGRQIVEAARKYNKICQTGTQSRSNPGIRDSIQFLHDGKLGKISVARSLTYKRRESIGKTTGDQPVPKTIDYNLWCGPASDKPPRRNGKHGSVHYDWHWFWEYGNGDLGNQGIHEMDKARWGLSKTGLPKSAISIGGRFGYVDDGETANTQVILFDYGDCELIHEVRGLSTKPPYAGDQKGNWIGNVYYGSEGYLVCPNYFSGVAYTKDGEEIQKFGGEGDHFANFLGAVRSRKSSDLNADILEGHISSSLCHFGNISHRLGQQVEFSKKMKAFGDSKFGEETFAKTEEHLKENGVPMDKTTYSLGAKLLIDVKTEKLVGNPEADALLRRAEYRKPFVVPDQV